MRFWREYLEVWRQRHSCKYICMAEGKKTYWEDKISASTSNVTAYFQNFFVFNSSHVCLVIYRRGNMLQEVLDVFCIPWNSMKQNIYVWFTALTYFRYLMSCSLHILLVCLFISLFFMRLSTDCHLTGAGCRAWNAIWILRWRPCTYRYSRIPPVT